MSTRDFFIRRFQIERPAFVSVLRALPSDRLDYKPHERSSAAGNIAWFLVLELRSMIQMVEDRDVHWKQEPKPESLDTIVAEYEKAADRMEKALASIDEAGWQSECRMFVGDRVIKSDPVGEMVWDFYFDAIHHRGQLTTYIRPMGGKVPSVYGPTADT